MLEPLFFKPIYKSIIWGGRNFEKVFKRELPEGKVAESWEVSYHKDDISIIENGALKGMNLKDAIDKYKGDIVGSKNVNKNLFPLLVKFIDANDKLSVQVHPDNAYAKKYENDLGKTEMWYIVDAKENAQLIYGTKKGTTKEQFKSALESGHLEDCLNYVNVKKGDVIYIPSGTVHAILDGILITEIQQSSDTTYRVYDWNRVGKDGKPRQLHVKKALDVINFGFEGKVLKPEYKAYDGYNIANAMKCEFFGVDIVNVKDSYKSSTDGTTFVIYDCVEGNGLVKAGDSIHEIKAGSSFMIPASCGEYEISGKLTVLKSYII